MATVTSVKQSNVLIPVEFTSEVCAAIFNRIFDGGNFYQIGKHTARGYIGGVYTEVRAVTFKHITAINFCAGRASDPDTVKYIATCLTDYSDKIFIVDNNIQAYKYIYWSE